MKFKRRKTFLKGLGITLALSLAVLNAPKTDYIYFIANIKTGETFFYSNASGFEAKKAELSKVNGGL